MNAKRFGLALIFALLMSGTFTLWMSKRITKKRSTTLPPKIGCMLQRGTTLNSGQQLRPGDLKLIEWPSSLP